MSAAAARPDPVAEERAVCVLIAALGGEGGGVLTDWIVQAATAVDLPVQSTSIPGVAQRTGATTYYVEVFPRTVSELGGRMPVMALYPSPGNIDVMVASEVLEAGRAMENGFVSPDRTTLIASNHRVYSIAEKTNAAASGLYPAENVEAAAEKLARRNLVDDLSRLAEETGSALNAVLLGAVAGSDALPIPDEAFADAIRARGIGVEPSLRGFAAGVAFAREGRKIGAPGPSPGEAASDAPRAAPAPPAVPGGVEALVRRVDLEFPAPVRPVLVEGVRRTADFQNPRYAETYLARLRDVADRDAGAGGEAREFLLTRETGRYLALWMTYEDVIRVADLKTRRERMDRVRDEVRAGPDEPLRVAEFLKPGVEELASVMPPWLGRSLTRWAERRNGARRWHLAMHVKTHSVSGFLRLWLLARLRWWRPRSYRFGEEQARIERWLGAVLDGAAADYDLALEIAECANLNKGYGDTFARGRANFLRILDEEVAPALAGTRPADEARDAIRDARIAALRE